MVKIEKPWSGIVKQKVDGISGEVWKLTDIIEYAKNLPIKEIPMEYISLDFLK